MLATNLRGTYLGIRVIGSAMRDRGRGRIVSPRPAGFATGATFDLNGGMLMR